MKKVVAMMLSLVLALGLMAGCGQKDAGKASGGTKTIESLKIAFSPYADADQITTATEPLEALLKAKLLEKGYDVQNIDMTSARATPPWARRSAPAARTSASSPAATMSCFPMTATCC